MEIVYTPGCRKGIGYEIFWKLAGTTLQGKYTLFCDSLEWEKTETLFGHIKNPRLSLERMGSGDEFSLLKSAIDYVSEKPHERALVTGPMRKSQFPTVNGRPTGHTETLATRFNRPHVTMIFVSDELQVVPMTRHIPLSEVPRLCTPKTLIETLDDLALVREKLSLNRVGLLGLNPHAGESGLIGAEEASWMNVFVKEFQSKVFSLEGPLSPDASLLPEIRSRFDILLSWYHDQLLPGFKGLYAHSSCQVTAGIPIIRTSVDHGVAADLYLKGIASSGGLLSAIMTAKKMLSYKAL